MLKITEQQLEELIKTELDICSHWGDLEDFDTEEEYYLESAEQDSYVFDYLPQCFPDLEEEYLWDIQTAVIDGIKERFI